MALGVLARTARVVWRSSEFREERTFSSTEIALADVTEHAGSKLRKEIFLSFWRTHGRNAVDRSDQIRTLVIFEKQDLHTTQEANCKLH